MGISWQFHGISWGISWDAKLLSSVQVGMQMLNQYDFGARLAKSQLPSSKVVNLRINAFNDMGMGQNPGTSGEPQVIAGIYGCE